MYLKLYPDSLSERHLARVTDILNAGGVIVYPTDTLYAFGCDMYNHKALERMAQLRGIRADKALFSLMCPDLSVLSDFTRPISNAVFKSIRRHTPGPFTFILPANTVTPKIFQSKRKTVGIRIPDHAVARAMAESLGHPLATASLKLREGFEDEDYLIEPELINEMYGDLVDAVIDGGTGRTEPSTVVDFTSDEPEVLRQGIGMFE